MKIVIAGSCRTPIAKAPGGKLKNWTAVDLMTLCFQETLRRHFVIPNHVIAGSVMHSSDAPNVARVAALRANIPQAVPAFSVQMNCGSGLRSITSAVQMIKAGDANCVLAGGTESMSNIPIVGRQLRKGQGVGYDPRVRMPNFVDALAEGLTDPITGEAMGKTAENIAEACSISRKDQDEFAIASHKKAAAATRAGKFKSQSILVKEDKEGKEQIVIAVDECVNPTLNAQTLALWPTIFKENGTVTPANSCPLSDGASSMLVMTEEYAKANGITPEAEIVGYGYAGCNPSMMGMGPVNAVNWMMSNRADGIRLSDVDFVELNEAFAAQALACQRILEIPSEKLNVWGGAIALGHPVGATGSILTAKAIALLKDQKKELAIITMCIGGGQGGAMLIRNM